MGSAPRPPPGRASAGPARRLGPLAVAAPGKRPVAGGPDAPEGRPLPAARPPPPGCVGRPGGRGSPCGAWAAAFRPPLSGPLVWRGRRVEGVEGFAGQGQRQDGDDLGFRMPKAA